MSYEAKLQAGYHAVAQSPPSTLSVVLLLRISCQLWLQLAMIFCVEGFELCSRYSLLHSGMNEFPRDCACLVFTMSSPDNHIKWQITLMFNRKELIKAKNETTFFVTIRYTWLFKRPYHLWCINQNFGRCYSKMTVYGVCISLQADFVGVL